MSGIYKITSPQGRVYVGQAVNIEKRLSDYQKLKCKSQTRLYNSLVKYGTINHTFKVIEECTIELLNERERYWQEYYEVLSEKGLNCKLTKAGDKSGIHSEETKKKQSKANIGKIISQDIRDKISKTLKGNIPWNKGATGLYKQTEDSNNKRSTSGKLASTVAKEVLQYSKEGQFMQEWSSARQVGIQLGKQSGSAITECCQGKRRTIYGFIFKYKTEVI
jgi:group I intron endonuclease